MKIQKAGRKNHISGIELTNDTLCSRGGLSLVMRYIDKCGFVKLINDSLGHLRKSTKGTGIGEIVRQIVANMIEGSDSAIVGFDRRKESGEHAAVVERDREQLVGSDCVKRFLKKFLGCQYKILRPILHELFVWRLLVERPEKIVLFLDTMVLDNDGALNREGVKPTYKKVKGFQPLQIHWGTYIIDMVFRSGEKHSNHGDEVVSSLKKVVGLIRSRYNADVPIIVSCDSGFMAEDNFIAFEQELGIHYICMGRTYRSLKEDIEHVDVNSLPVVNGTHGSWGYYDFGSRLDSWSSFRRTIFTTTICEDDQYVLPVFNNDSFIYTNVGTSPLLDKKLSNAGYASLADAGEIVRLAHRNGECELNHREIKEFMGRESLPFEHFGMNAAYYYLMLISQLFFESYRHDVAQIIVPIRAYATKLRRTLIDFACKVVYSGGRVVLKVTNHIWKTLRINELWERCNHPPPLPCV